MGSIPVRVTKTRQTPLVGVCLVFAPAYGHRTQHLPRFWSPLCLFAGAVLAYLQVHGFVSPAQPSGSLLTRGKRGDIEAKPQIPVSDTPRGCLPCFGDPYEISFSLCNLDFTIHSIFIKLFFLLTNIVEYAIIILVRKYPENTIRWRLLPLIGNADSFCLPERGGDADVRYLGIAVPVRRIHHSSFDIHRQS